MDYRVSSAPTVRYAHRARRPGNDGWEMRAAVIVTARGLSPDHRQSPPRIKRGRRGTPETCRSPRSGAEKWKAPELSSAVGQLVTGIPRAVFEALFRSSPGGVTKPSFWERPFYPPLAGRSPVAPYLGYESTRPVGPVAPGRDAGQLWLQPPIIACERQPATAPDPHSKTPLETPLVDQDGHRINPLEELGIRNPKVFLEKAYPHFLPDCSFCRPFSGGLSAWQPCRSSD
jgi:hypothetical protein